MKPKKAISSYEGGIYIQEFTGAFHAIWWKSDKITTPHSRKHTSEWAPLESPLPYTPPGKIHPPLPAISRQFLCLAITRQFLCVDDLIAHFSWDGYYLPFIVYYSYMVRLNLFKVRLMCLQFFFDIEGRAVLYNRKELHCVRARTVRYYYTRFPVDVYYYILT